MEIHSQGIPMEVTIGQSYTINIHYFSNRFNKDYNGTLERIVNAGEALTEEEVTKYYGENWRTNVHFEGVSMRPKSIRLMFKLEDSYLVIPVNLIGLLPFAITIKEGELK